MNRTEQMVMDFQCPGLKLNHRHCRLRGCTRSLSAIGESQILRALPFQRLSLTTLLLFQGREASRFSNIFFRAALDCLAMVGCVMFAVLATLLFGL